MSERERYRVPNQGGRMSTNEPMTQERLAEARTTLDDDMSQWGSEYGLELIAEVERLRTRLTVDKEMVERVVRAFYEHPTPGVDASLRTDWDRLAKASPDVADNYRRSMAAALDTALGTGENG